MISCNPKNDYDNISVINIEQAFKRKETYNLSHIAQSIEYIRLESKEECMIDRGLKVYLSNEYIIAIAFRQMFLFDKYSGKFIREIGHYGRDPESYTRTLFTMSYDQTNEILYAGLSEQKGYILYSLENEVINEIIVPRGVIAMAPLGENKVYYIRNVTGNEQRKLIIYEKGESPIKIFPNYQRYTPDKGLMNSYGVDCVFYHHENNLNFYELFTDTVFQVTPQKLIPKHVFDMGQYAPPYEKQISFDFPYEEQQKFFFIKNLFESSWNIFFSFNYQGEKIPGLYDKTEQKTYVLKEGIKNDLDYFISFFPTSIYQDNYLIGYAQAYEIAAWFEANPELAEKLPDNLKQFKELDLSDNPIVMIVKLKE